MARIHTERMTAEMDDEFVVFLIGMRFNRIWKVHKWLPVFMAMIRMLDELRSRPELGMLHYEAWLGRTTMMIQYWESFDSLEAYAGSHDSRHLPAWTDFNRKIAGNGDVGIWHETYLSGPGRHECFYRNMPSFGLAQAGRHLPAVRGRATAGGRLANRRP